MKPTSRPADLFCGVPEDSGFPAASRAILSASARLTGLPGLKNPVRWPSVLVPGDDPGSDERIDETGVPRAGRHIMEHDL